MAAAPEPVDPAVPVPAIVDPLTADPLVEPAPPAGAPVIVPRISTWLLTYFCRTDWSPPSSFTRVVAARPAGVVSDFPLRLVCETPPEVFAFVNTNALPVERLLVAAAPVALEAEGSVLKHPVTVT